MRLYLVHHGAAISPSLDPQQPLSDEGRTLVERLAEQAAQRSTKPAVIWHSGKLRARQTVDAYWRACNPLAVVSAARGLQSGDDPERIADTLVGETRDIMLVGHMPHIDRLLRLLVENNGGDVTPFPAHGIVTLESSDDAWAECWRLAR